MKGHGRLATLVLLCGSLVVSLVAVEAGLHVYYAGRSEGQNLVSVEPYRSPFIFKGKPGSSFVDAGVEFRINNLGMRRHSDVVESPAPGVTRVLSYGDSIANGWAVANEHTYAYRLESELDRPDSGRFEVLNMYRGATPTLASFHIRADVSRLQTTGVILQIELLNDTSDEALLRTTGTDRDGLPTRVVRSRYVLGYDDRLLASLTLSGSFLERTKTWSAISHVVGSLASLAAEGSVRSSIDPLFIDQEGAPHYYYNLGFDRFLLDERAISRGFEQMFESMAGIHRLLERQDIRFLILVLPSRYAFADGPFRQAARSILHRAEELAVNKGLPFVSLLDGFEAAGGEQLFMDFCHPTPAGNAAIAKALLPVLENWRSG